MAIRYQHALAIGYDLCRQAFEQIMAGELQVVTVQLWGHNTTAARVDVNRKSRGCRGRGCGWGLLSAQVDTAGRGPRPLHIYESRKLYLVECTVEDAQVPDFAVKLQQSVG